MDRNLERFTEEGLPIRPGQKLCGVYSKTGNCPYGSRCKFDHHVKFMNRPRSSLESLDGRHGFHRHGPRRMGYHHDTRRYPMRTRYHDPGPLISGSRGVITPVSLSNETSPRHQFPDHSPRSTNDVSGNIYQSSSSSSSINRHVSVISHHDSGSRDGLFHFYGENGRIRSGRQQQLEKDNEEEESHSNLKHLFQVVDQKKEEQVHREGNTFNGLTWPAIASHWYPAGSPNEEMKARLGKNCSNINTAGIVTMASHIIKPIRIKEGNYNQE
eukprot:g1106.t1